MSVRLSAGSPIRAQQRKPFPVTWLSSCWGWETHFKEVLELKVKEKKNSPRLPCSPGGEFSTPALSPPPAPPAWLELQLFAVHCASNSSETAISFGFKSIASAVQHVCCCLAKKVN